MKFTAFKLYSLMSYSLVYYSPGCNNVEKNSTCVEKEKWRFLSKIAIFFAKVLKILITSSLP